MLVKLVELRCCLLMLLVPTAPTRNIYRVLFAYDKHTTLPGKLAAEVVSAWHQEAFDVTGFQLRSRRNSDSRDAAPQEVFKQNADPAGTTDVSSLREPRKRRRAHAAEEVSLKNRSEQVTISRCGQLDAVLLEDTDESLEERQPKQRKVSWLDDSDVSDHLESETRHHAAPEFLSQEIGNECSKLVRLENTEGIGLGGWP